MRRTLFALLLLAPLAAFAQTADTNPPPPPKAKTKARAKVPAGKKPIKAPAEVAAPATGTEPAAAAPAKSDAAQAAQAAQAAPAGPEKPAVPQFDQEEFRRQVMEEVRKELQKTRDQVKQETSWVEQDSQARVQDSEAVEQLKQRVNIFQPHGYLRMRGEFFNNLTLGRGADQTGHQLFPGPYIGIGQTTDQATSAVGFNNNKSQSDLNFRFRFEPTFEISEDLAIFLQLDMLDNILLGSNPKNDPFLDPFTPLAVFNTQRLSSAVNVKRVWAKVNTQLGELVFGRMGYHWGLGILHNDGNCLDCDYGDTYDRVAFTPRTGEFLKGHHATLMFDVLDKGASTTGEHGELGRSVDLDTLDDGYRLGLSITKLDTPEEVKRKLDANQWVVNYGAIADFRTQGWDTPVQGVVADSSTLAGLAALRGSVVRRGAKLYQPDAFLSLKRKKWRLDAEVAMNIGSVATRQTIELGLVPAANLTQPITFFQAGGALQTDVALLPADALLLGLEMGAASGDPSAYGFGARPWRSGSGNPQPVPTNAQNQPYNPFNATGPGDIDGTHLDFSNPDHTHGRVNNFVFNRAFNVDMILFRNLVTSVTSAWYLKPSVRYRPTGRKTGGGDDSGFELNAGILYSQAWYAENTPGLAKPLGAELNVGITYDTSDRFHFAAAYGLLLPFAGLRNGGFDAAGVAGANPPHDASIAHVARFIMAIPF